MRPGSVRVSSESQLRSQHTICIVQNWLNFCKLKKRRSYNYLFRYSQNKLDSLFPRRQFFIYPVYLHYFRFDFSCYFFSIKGKKKIGKFEYNIPAEKRKYVYAIASRRTGVSCKLLFSLGKPNYCRTDCALINDTFYATAFSFNIVGNIRNDNTISSVRWECVDNDRLCVMADVCFS